ncbi:MAG TPA: 50S ribosomal protein L6 [Candidatus Enterousia avicola]|uniref:50S ribosomal protein L6 n=1 Tax=Candidatus Enterousia avicola TaxID=2840787 RepID=A0A9D1MRS4_9PROT|nr:50S ribosomal protein L6 [Candidatus Enterousia avicola]
MSRAGKHPVKLKDGVSAVIADGVLTVKGPKGEIKVSLDTKHAGLVDVAVEADQVVVTPKDAEDKTSRAMWGTMARNVRAAVEGITDGFKKEMYMKGVGYKASVNGNKLVLVAGYSHDVVMDIPEGLTVKMGETPTEFTISGIDKCLVGQFADKVHKVRKADPYKGKGIFYKGERIRRKEGKKK